MGAQDGEHRVEFFAKLLVDAFITAFLAEGRLLEVFAADEAVAQQLGFDAVLLGG